MCSYYDCGGSFIVSHILPKHTKIHVQIYAIYMCHYNSIKLSKHDTLEMDSEDSCVTESGNRSR